MSIILYFTKVGLIIFQFWTPHFVVLTPHFGWTPRLNYTVAYLVHKYGLNYDFLLIVHFNGSRECYLFGDHRVCCFISLTLFCNDVIVHSNCPVAGTVLSTRFCCSLVHCGLPSSLTHIRYSRTLSS